jgi:hypothetical protein
MSAEKIVMTETKWEVQLPSQNGLTQSAEFDTEENARNAWAENQPSLLSGNVRRGPRNASPPSRQLARTPENFPRMKHRAAGRHAKRQVAQIQTATSALGEMSLAVKRVVEGMAKMAESFAEAFRALPSQSDFALVPDNTKQ